MMPKKPPYSKINTQGAIILLSIGFSLGLLLVRFILTNSGFYLFLTWNLFLAAIPYLISLYIMSMRQRKWFKLLPLLFLWIIFLPNAPYILTDLFHLHKGTDVPAWFDLILILSFAWNGLLFWFISIFKIESVLQNRIPNSIINLGIWMVFLLSGAGVYIGRYIRFNSWDLFLHPHYVMKEISIMVFNPLSHPGFYGMTISVSVFLLLIYAFFNGLTQLSHKVISNGEYSE